MSGEGGAALAWATLFAEHLAWPALVAAVLVWLSRQTALLDRLTQLSFGGLELQLAELEKKVEAGQAQISALENELERERKLFEEVLEGFDPHAPVEQLAAVRERLKANARQLRDMSVLGEFLGPQATAEQLYAAAATLRETRATEWFEPLVACLDRLARDGDLGGVRLNTVWTLTSALHWMLIAAVRDGVGARPSDAALRRAREMLDRLEANPRAQADRPDAPDAGVRGPLRHARSWIDRALGA